MKNPKKLANGAYQLSVEIGIRISVGRKREGLTQEQLAQKINNQFGKLVDMNRKKLSRIENGQQPINIEEAMCICNCLNMSVLYLLFGDKSKNKTIDMGYYTGLSEESIQWLHSNKEKSPHLIEMLNLIFKDEKLANALLGSLYAYATNPITTVTRINKITKEETHLPKSERKYLMMAPILNDISIIYNRLANVYDKENSEILESKANDVIEQFKKTYHKRLAQYNENKEALQQENEEFEIMNNGLDE